MNKKNYSILSVKILKAGIEISYYDMKVDRNISIEDKKNSPHPDLVNAIQSLNEYLARTHLLPQEKYSQVSSTGFVIKSDTIVVLKGMLTAPSEKKLAINSDAIDLSKDAYGFEDDLQTVINIVVTEAGKYLFEGKMIKQAKLDFEERQQDEEKPEESTPLEDVDIPVDVKESGPDKLADSTGKGHGETGAFGGLYKEKPKEETSDKQYADQEPGEGLIDKEQQDFEEPGDVSDDKDSNPVI